MLSAIKAICPADWKNPSNMNSDYELVEISTDSHLYTAIKQITHHYRNRETTRIVEVRNPYLFTQFMLKQAEYKTRGSWAVQRLFHDTAARKIPLIASGNLDRRFANRVKYGRGVSFSPDPAYANLQSSRDNGVDRAMIVAEVLVGTTQCVTGCQTLPRVGCDTTVGNGRKVYVKYYDDEFYPKYVVFYNNGW